MWKMLLFSVLFMGSLFIGDKPAVEERRLYDNQTGLQVRISTSIYEPRTGPEGGPWYPSGTQTLFILMIENLGTEEITGIHISNDDSAGKSGMCVGIWPDPPGWDIKDMVLPHTMSGGYGPPLQGFEWIWGECDGCPPKYEPFMPGKFSVVFYAVNFSDDETYDLQNIVTITGSDGVVAGLIYGPCLPRQR